MTKSFKTIALAGALAGATLGACATQTGPAAIERFDRVDLRADIGAIAAYDRVYLAPISAASELIEDATTRRIGPVTGNDDGFEMDLATVTAKMKDLREELLSALGETAIVVEAPGPGVLTIEVVLDDLASNRPTMPALRRTPSLDFRSFGIGDAGVTVALKDDLEVLAVIEDDAFVRNLNDPGVGVGVWTTADRFFERFSDRLASLFA